MNEIRRINGEEYMIDGEPEMLILTISNSIEYAENALERRLKQHLDSLHNVQLLKTKDLDQFTDEDFFFLKQVVCADGACGSEGVSSQASVLVGSVLLCLTAAHLL